MKYAASWLARAGSAALRRNRRRSRSSGRPLGVELSACVADLAVDVTCVALAGMAWRWHRADCRYACGAERTESASAEIR